MCFIGRELLKHIGVHMLKSDIYPHTTVGNNNKNNEWCMTYKLMNKVAQ